MDKNLNIIRPKRDFKVKHKLLSIIFKVVPIVKIMKYLQKIEFLLFSCFISQI